MRLSIIVAMSENSVIGHDGKLPWRQKADLNRFRILTDCCPVIMGRKTWESIHIPLTNRIPIVLSRDPFYFIDGVCVAHSFENALEITQDYASVFVAGGREVYAAALPYAELAYITRIHAMTEGDTEFPRGMGHDWTRFDWQTYPADKDNEHPYTLEIWTRNAQHKHVSC